MPEYTMTEAALGARLRRADGVAFDEMYSLYSHRLYSFVYYQVDRNQAAAEDIVQETFLAAIHSARQFNGQSKVYTWLCGIAFHKVADYYRHQRRERCHRSATFDIDDTDAHWNSETLGVSSSHTDAAENRSLIESAMSNLSPHYRQVLLLKYVEGFSVIEISQIMQRSQKSVEGLLSRARKAMQDNMPQIDKA